MIQDDVAKNLWPNILSILLIGNSVVNNFAEPQIQLGELLKKLPNLEKNIGDTCLPDEKKKLVQDELQRQLHYITVFSQKLDEVKRELKLLEGKKDS